MEYRPLGLAIASLLAISSFQVAAQDEAAANVEQQGGSGLEEVVVTARKREESISDVPVAISAYSKDFIETNAITSVSDLTALAPGLVSANATGETGGFLFMRGIGSGQLSALLDQSVALNVDGAQVGGQILYASTIDLQQIEVLRGSQALFFGKNSPAGVISITTAGATDEFESSVKAGYEVDARQKYGQFTVSGPLSDTLGGRVMGYYSTQEGYYDVKSAVVSEPAAFASTGFNNSRGPARDEQVFRGVLEFEPNDRLRATAKVTYGKVQSDDGYAMNMQIVSCGTGRRQAFLPQYAAVEDCTANDTIVTGNISDTELATSGYYRNEPTGFVDDDIMLGVATVDYDITDSLALSSVSSYYSADINAAQSYSLQPTPFLASSTGIDTSRIAQELRLLTKFDAPVNVMFGGYYETGDALAYIHTEVPLAGLIVTEITDQDATAWSAFVQATWNMTDALELSAGGRYSDETKDARYSSTFVPGVPGSGEYSANNFSPEVSLTYKPVDGVTLYGSYRQGFKSGGLDASFRSAQRAALGMDTTYDEETVQGAEFGLKTVSEDGRLRTNWAVFMYDFKDLQQSYSEPGTFSVNVVNAAKASNSGVEFDFQWAPIDGWMLQGGLAYLQAQYDDYIANCYKGQSIADGCSLGLNPATGNYTLQDLSGERIVRAPEYSGNLGVTYETSVAANWGMSLTSMTEFSSRFQAEDSNHPDGIQPSYVRTNLTAMLFTHDRAWQIALIARNLTDKYVVTRASVDTLSGAATGTSASVPVDLWGSVERGRTIALELTKRFW